MDEYVVIKLKNHKEYNKKILFVMVTCNKFDCPKSMMEEILSVYKGYLEENPNTAWEGASMVCKLNNLAKKNVLCSCIIMGNKMIKDLFNTVSKVHPVVVPYKIVDNNQDALAFVTEKMKN